MRRIFIYILISISGFLALSSANAQNQARPPASPLDETSLFDELPVVEAASLHTQTLEEAPANVTVISASDIRKYGYRTLGEALANVRGFDVTYDRMYHYLGVHGFSIPGDYNTRVLVMLNGHPLTENVFGSNNFFGQDFGLDMDLVERIEVVRGPSSALYGSNAIFATINVVTKSPVDHSASRITTETGSFGEKKVLASAAVYLGGGANLLVSASVFHNGGQSLYFPEFDSPETNLGRADKMDGERGYHTFASLMWKDWDLTAYFNSREKQPPVNYDMTALFNHPGTFVEDSRNFISLSHTKPVGANGKLRWRMSYDNYRYDDRFFYPLDSDIQDFRNLTRNDWITANMTYSLKVPAMGDLTVGVEGIAEFRNLQENLAVYPVRYVQLHVSEADRDYAVFAQQEWNLSKRWTAVLGLRFDHDGNSGNSLSPRLALVHQRSKQTVYKFVYGRPFRNPSSFEQNYTDGIAYLRAAELRPETAQTFEASVERKLRPKLAAILTGYHYHINDLIQTAYLPGDMQQFQNASGARSTGAEAEITGAPSKRLEATASVALQRARDTRDGDRMANSARVIGKARVSVPVVFDRFYVSSSAQYAASRLTFAGQSLRPVVLMDLTATYRGVLRRNFDMQFGIRNLLNRGYDDPVALAVDRMRQDGRSAFLKLSWSFGE